MCAISIDDSVNLNHGEFLPVKEIVLKQTLTRSQNEYQGQNLGDTSPTFMSIQEIGQE